jgi:hypothetical protein
MTTSSFVTTVQFILGMFTAGLITAVADKFVRQHVIEPTIEKKHLPDNCKQYRRTKIHFVSLFITGMTVYLLIHLLHLQQKVE